MNRILLPVPLAVAIALLTTPAHPQGTKADYARAAALPKQARGTVRKNQLRPRWLPDESALWYRLDGAHGQREFVLVDIAGKRRQPLFDHERLAESLRNAGLKSATGKRLPVLDLEIDGSDLFLWLRGDSRVWRVNRKSYAVQIIDANDTRRFRLRTAGPQVRSRNGGGETRIVFVNMMAAPVELLWIDTGGAQRSYGKLAPGEIRAQHTFARHAWAIRNDKGAIIQRFVAEPAPRIAAIDQTSFRSPNPARDARVSPDGKWRVKLSRDDVALIRTGQREKQWFETPDEAGTAFGGAVWWSPDSRRFVALRTSEVASRTIPLVESAPGDALQPRLHTVNYVKPGDPLPHPRPWLFDVKTRLAVPVDDTHFPNPWSLNRFRWSRDSKTVYFAYNERGHQKLAVLALDATANKVRVAIEEKSKTFVDYAGKFFLRQLDKTDELIWMSERDGWNHLYLYDRQTGKVKNRITEGAWPVRKVDRVNDKTRQIWFWAGGVRPGEDPYHLHYCRANLDGTGFTILTEGDGTHTVEFSPKRRTFVDTWSRVDLPPVRVLRSGKDGSLICELERADWSALLATGWKAPERFVAKGRDGKTDIYGIIHRPSNFDPQKQYPIVEAIYAGPHGAHVPKAFREFHGAQGVAELGFIVVQIDGMGTSYRSKAFHDVCWKNLADAGFSDRIAWIRAAAKRYPQMDLSRVGIYGGSAGGQNAMRGLLAHPDFYKVGVADCGCHDNRMDKIWWNELWMGWPIGPHYAEQSNVTQAHKLQGKLMLIVGELDRNVDPASTMQVVHALVKANKDFDLVVLPGVGHGAAGTPYGRRRQRDFLVRHLHGVEPREG